LGRDLKIYYRELIARFAHFKAITWNIGEENTNSDADRRDFATFLRTTDLRTTQPFQMRVGGTVAHSSSVIQQH